MKIFFKKIMRAILTQNLLIEEPGNILCFKSTYSSFWYCFLLQNSHIILFIKKRKTKENQGNAEGEKQREKPPRKKKSRKDSGPPIVVPVMRKCKSAVVATQELSDTEVIQPELEQSIMMRLVQEDVVVTGMELGNCFPCLYRLIRVIVIKTLKGRWSELFSFNLGDALEITMIPKAK